MLLGTLGAILLGNMLVGKGVKLSKIPGRRVLTAGEDTIRVCQHFDVALSLSFGTTKVLSKQI